MECFYAKGTANTDKTSNEYIFVNNFGYNKNINQEFCVKRKKGRLDYQIIYIDKGYGYFLLDGKFIKADKGSIIILQPGKENYYKFSAEALSDYYWIHFTGSGVYELLKKLKLDRSIFTIGDFYEFKDVIKSMSKVATVEDFTTDSYLSSSVGMLLSQISKKLYVPENPLRKVLIRMQNENVNTLTNLECADMCRMSEYHFIRTFKKFTGVTPHRYMAKITVTKAIDLLLTTTLNISEIAHLLDFDDSLYFSRFFKKETGVSPQNFIKTHK